MCEDKVADKIDTLPRRDKEAGVSNQYWDQVKGAAIEAGRSSEGVDCQGRFRISLGGMKRRIFLQEVCGGSYPHSGDGGMRESYWEKRGKEYEKFDW